MGSTKEVRDAQGTVLTIEVQTLRANPVSGQVPELVLIARTPVGEESEGKTLAEMDALYDNEARRIVGAMSRSLPGGLVDAILRDLLLQRRCHFTVPLVSQDEGKQGRTNPC